MFALLISCSKNDSSADSLTNDSNTSANNESTIEENSSTNDEASTETVSSDSTDTTETTPEIAEEGVPAIFNKMYAASRIYLDGSFVVIKVNGAPDHKSPYYSSNSDLYEAYNGTNTAFNLIPKSVITIGAVNVLPNSRNTVPGGTVFSIDSRSPNDKVLSDLELSMRQICRDIAKDRNVSMRFESISYTPPIEFDEKCISEIEMAARNRQIGYMNIYSGAGHDACHMSTIVPTGMIFVPCKDGVSHNERESAEPKDLAEGCSVLLDVMTSFAG